MNIKAFVAGAVCCALLTGVYTLLQQGTGGFGFSDSGGAVKFVGKHDIKASPYYSHPDIFNMQSSNSLTLLQHFKTRQQVTAYTCGPAAAAMVVENALGRDLHAEREIGKIMGTSTTKGTDTVGMVKYFETIGWSVESNLDKGSPQSYTAFLKFVKQHLDERVPIIVENIDWGGHWRVIIGYDTMGTSHTGDDVLIMADPFDTSDHLQDGYNIVPAERFFYTWFDAHLFKPGQQDKLWLAAKPKQ